MQIAPFVAVLLGSQLMTSISDRVPQLNVEATCKAIEATDKAMRLSEPQSFADCMRDETTAQQQLSSAWPTSSGATRDRCEREATVDANQSYVDLLTCIQMAGEASSLSPAASLKGASKKRNEK